jgi:predicted ATPase/DNA-binding winged helix-turn-helix (wHTH) protein
MSVPPDPPSFEHFQIRAAERRLIVDGQPVEIGARAFDLLLVLVERRDRVVPRHEILDLVWPGLVVEDNNINVHVLTLRKLLGREVIATLPGRGYRFTAVPLQERLGTAVSKIAPSAPPRAGLRQSNLPRLRQTLRGRTDELAALTQMIEQHTLVTVVGAGGIGKTLLVQHLLESQLDAYGHGVCWVELATLSDASALPGAVAQALGVVPGTGDALPGLCRVVAPLSVLIALDNAEHLVDGVAQLCQGLLDAAPGVRIVVTSQAALRLPLERVYRIGPLAVPDVSLPAVQALHFSAVELFVERARAADPHFAFTDRQAPGVIEICRALDGMALAIELAAARAPMLGVERLVASMQHRLRLLTAGAQREAPARHQTLRAALAWSHGLLDERERVVFRRLAVFNGSCSLELAQQVTADEAAADNKLDEWEVIDALSVLIDRSLLTLVDGDDDAPPRYRLLNSARAFALECLAATGEGDRLRQRHARALADHLGREWSEGYGGRVGFEAWSRRINADAGNARDALHTAHEAGDANMAMTIAATWLLSMPAPLHAQILALAVQCEALTGQVSDRGLLFRGWTAIARARAIVPRSNALAAAEHALAIARELDSTATDRWPLVWALGGWLPLAPPELATLQLVDELVVLTDPAWPPQRRFWTAQSLLVTEYRRNDPARRSLALHWARESASLAEAAGGTPVYQLANLVAMELSAGDPDAAVQIGAALLVRLEGTRNEMALSFARLYTSAALLALTRAAEARPLLRAAWTQAQRFGLLPYLADYMALLAALEGRSEAAATIIGYADAAYARAGAEREPNESAAVARVRKATQEALGDERCEALGARGALLHDAALAALALDAAADS